MPRLLRAFCLLLIGGLLAAPSAAQTVVGPTVDYQGDLPPLIDRQTFFGDPQVAGAQISPNGQHVSFLKEYKGMMNVWVKGMDESFEDATPVTADTTRPVRGYFWSQDSERILYVQDKGGNENFHVYAVDPDAEEQTDLGVPPARDLTPYEDVRAQIYAVPEATPGRIIVGLNDRNPQYHDAYAVDLETGERTLLYENTQRIAGWQTDLQGNLRLAVRSTSEGGTEVLRLDGDSLTTVYTCSFEESCNPIRFHKDGERVYMSTNKGEDVDLQRLVLFNPQTGETELVEEDPEGRVDFGGAIFSDATNEMLATVYNGDRQRIYPKTDEFAADLEFLQNELDGQLSFRGSTEDGRMHVIGVSSDVDPGSVYLFNREAQSLERLYRSRPDLPSENLAEMEAIRYESRDGLSIPAYLTLPKGVEAENLPLVVYVHGGPWARDTWGYDSYAQFFANRGYAVLQVNFRGSTGYGKEFLNAGNKEWGDAMQDDLTDGVQYLVDQGTVNPDRVGIFGGSYGGYATLAGLTFTPEVYSAGASYVGPSNLITLLNSIPPYWASFKKTLEKRVGDPDDPEDRERMKRQSPFFSANEIDDPLLVIQGANDPRVKKQESDQIVVAARENDLGVEYLVAPEEGHGFAKENNRLAVAARLEAFFGEHLGGRYQEDMTEPVQMRLDALTVDPNSVTLPDSLSEAESDAEAKAKSESTAMQMDGSKLSAATLSYNVGMSMGGQSMDQSTTRTITKSTHNGTPVWMAVETANGPMGTVTDSVLVHQGSVRPLARHVRGPLTIDVTYGDTTATGMMKARGQEIEIDQSFDRPTLAGGPNVDLAIASLPLAPGYTASLQTFSPQQMKTSTVTLEVTGTETVETEAGSFETYVVEMTQANQGSGTLYVKKDGAHYVVKADMKMQSPRGTIDVTRTLASME